jgi:hypothetical protein
VAARPGDGGEELVDREYPYFEFAGRARRKTRRSGQAAE